MKKTAEAFLWISFISGSRFTKEDASKPISLFSLTEYLLLKPLELPPTKRPPLLLHVWRSFFNTITKRKNLATISMYIFLVVIVKFFPFNLFFFRYLCNHLLTTLIDIIIFSPEMKW